MSAHSFHSCVPSTFTFSWAAAQEKRRLLFFLGRCIGKMSNCKPGVWKFFLTWRYLNKGMPWACFWSIWWGERCRRLRCAPEPCTPRAQWTFHHGRGRRTMSRFPASQRHTGKTSARKTGQLNTTVTRCTPLQKPSTWHHELMEAMNEHAHTLILPEGQAVSSDIPEV